MFNEDYPIARGYHSMGLSHRDIEKIDRYIDRSIERERERERERDQGREIEREG